jgi:hypothetical protein
MGIKQITPGQLLRREKMFKKATKPNHPYNKNSETGQFSSQEF